MRRRHPLAEREAPSTYCRIGRNTTHVYNKAWAKNQQIARWRCHECGVLASEAICLNGHTAPWSIEPVNPFANDPLTLRERRLYGKA